MDPNAAMQLVALAVLCFVLRALPRWRYKHVLVSDTYFHLFCADAIRKHNGRLPISFDRILFAHETTYPYLYHALLARLSPAAARRMERYNGAVFDTVMVVVVYLFLTWYGASRPQVVDRDLPFLTGLLFCLAPALVRIGWGPRVYSGSPRVLGQALYLLHICTAYHAISSGSIGAALVAVVCGALALTASKFTTQVLMFFGIGFAVFISPGYLLVLAGTFVVSIGISRGKVLRVLKGQIRHSIFYKKYTEKYFRGFLQADKNSLRRYGQTLRKLASLARQGKWAPALEWFYFERHALHQLLTVFPHCVVLGVLWLMHPEAAAGERFMMVWCLNGLACFVLTEWKPLHFLGEGERYLEYALLPSLYLSVKWLLSADTTALVAIVVYSTGIYGLTLYYFRKNFAPVHQRHAGLKDMFARHNRMPAGNILPIGNFHWLLLYFSTMPVVTYYANKDETFVDPADFDLIYGNFPYPAKAFGRILADYRVDYIITDRAQLDYYTDYVLKDRATFECRTRLLLQADNVMIFAVTV